MEYLLKATHLAEPHFTQVSYCSMICCSRMFEFYHTFKGSVSYVCIMFLSCILMIRPQHVHTLLCFYL
jgi:hypothetical protein